LAFANFSRAAHPKIKAWPSMLRVGHEAQELILEKIMLRNPKGKPGPNLHGYNVKEERTQFPYSLTNVLTFCREKNLLINCSFQALLKILEFSSHICCSKSNFLNLKIVKLNTWSRSEINFGKKKSPYGCCHSTFNKNYKDFNSGYMEVFMYLTARTSISICQMSTALCKKLCTF
jgi:hypothetical protein